MKKIVFGLLGLLLFAGCSDDHDSDMGLTEELREIRLRAAVQSPDGTRAPINSDFTANFPIGVYAYTGTSWKAGSSANFINNDSATVSGTTGHSVLFKNGPYYYPVDGGDVHFFAFAPSAAEKTAAGASSSPIVSFTMTGQEDIMWDSFTASKSNSTADGVAVFNFVHKLTQLQFTFLADQHYPDGGYSVVSLTVNGQPNNADMVVDTGILTFSGSAAMQAIQAGAVSITRAGTNANAPVMTKPAGSFSLSLTIRPVGGGSDITYTNVPLTLNTLAGSAHMVTLQFNSTGVTASTTVTPWASGDSGSVSIL